MSRCWTILLVALLAAAQAGAVSLTMATDDSVYTAGEDVTLTVTGDTTGAAAAVAAFVRVGYSPFTLVDGLGAVAMQTGTITSFDGAVAWNPASPACQIDSCVVINQIGLVMPAVPDPAIIIGTLVLPTVAAGVLELAAIDVDWFGAAAPPAITVTIVPEPAAAALVAQGLVGLALLRRHR
jgi:hypothetical protein